MKKRIFKMTISAVLLSVLISSCGIEDRESNVTLPVGGTPNDRTEIGRASCRERV